MADVTRSQLQVTGVKTKNNNMASLHKGLRLWHFPKLLHFTLNAFPSGNKCFLNVRKWIE